MKMTRHLLLVLALSLTLAACGSKDAGNSSNGTGGGGTTGGVSAGDPTLADPKGSIAYQFELVKAGDADKLRNCFTERLRDRITRERVDKAKGEAGRYTMDDLWASAEPGEYEGKKTMKVKMKNGRTLTTLVQTDGKWLSDTVWFD
ncbi:MAG TPA: hypothetical protein VN256_03145 [Pyrinomonadaceae bacterium]|nr:hypothetical protein [Pyrinomonadaceae bacterium]